MRLALVCVGKLKAGPERLLFDRYLKRLKESARSAGIAGVDVREIRESRARRPEERRAEEGAAILAAVSKGGVLILLDERGPSIASEEWAADIGQARDASRPVYTVAIGGPDGLDSSLGAAAHRMVSFGSMTWPHQLVRVMAGEQLYRAMTILAGHPYHRR
ncbi:MAG TPA: 23S rRNA (pseudouridine(1915)-N(3))-methyltransferase RlmH [Roseiarcus sp.]|jgi:23S rRNA (pseudouridine1915-N3)-methyltransferase